MTRNGAPAFLSIKTAVYGVAIKSLKSLNYLMGTIFEFWFIILYNSILNHCSNQGFHNIGGVIILLRKITAHNFFAKTYYLNHEIPWVSAIF